MKIAIVGLGLIGGSFGLAVKARGHVEVLGVARRQETADLAVTRGAVDRAGTDLALVADVDVVVLACPHAVTNAVLNALASHLADGTRVTDVGSTKEAVVRHAARALDPARNPFLGGHPMAGKEVTGLENADPDLFRGRPWVFTPASKHAPGGWEDFVGLVRDIGAVPVFLQPRAHDHYVALVSHLPFLLSSAYLLAAGREAAWGDASELASSGFRDMSRLGAGDSEMYAAITATNRDAVLDTLTALHAALEQLEAAITRGEGDELLDLLVEARRTRDEWAAAHPDIS